MRKKLMTAFAVLSLAALASGCSFLHTGSSSSPKNSASGSPTSASSSASLSATEHTEHSYVWVAETAATCDKTGLKGYFYCSECSKTFDANKQPVSWSELTIPKSGHSYTCTDNGDGTHTKKCANCNDEKTLPHAYTREVTEEKYLKSPATCTEVAVYYKSCECGACSTEETFTYGEALGHDFDEKSGVCKNGCGINIKTIADAIAQLPQTAEGITLPDVKKIQTMYAVYADLDEATQAKIQGGKQLADLYEAVKNITVLSSANWSSDVTHYSPEPKKDNGDAYTEEEKASEEYKQKVDAMKAEMITFTSSADKKYGEYVEAKHTAGWANLYMNAELTPETYVVFYVYNPSETDWTISYGYQNDGNSDSIFGGEDLRHTVLKAKAWTRVSFRYTMNYSVKDMRFVMGAKAGDGTNITDMKLSAWYIVDEIKTITDLAYDKSLTYTFVEEVEAKCEEDGMKAHYTSGEKFYNEYYEEVTEAELKIPATGHTYGENGECACGESLQPLIDEIAALPDTATLAAIGAIKTAYAKYDKLPEAAKPLVTNGEKLVGLYDTIKDITIYEGGLENGGQNTASMSFTTGTDEKYGAYTEITHTGEWGNFKINCTETPSGKTLVIYVYNPYEQAISFAYGTAENIYKAEKANACTLKAQAWTRVSIEWTYSHNVSALIFLTGTHAGTGENMTGMLISSVYIVDEIKTITDLVYDRSLTYTFVAEVAAKCEEDGMKAHYTSGEKFYNEYHEEVAAEELIIPATGHTYGENGECECGESLQPLIDEIAALPDTATLAAIGAIKTAYAKYDKLPEAAKPLVTNGDKLEGLYDSVKDITVYESGLAHGEQNGEPDYANMSFASGTDDVYGAYTEITHTSNWGNFKVNCTETPIGKIAVWYVYNPNASEMQFSYGTATTVYNHDDSRTCTLAANAWTQVAIEWTYEYNISTLIFVFGEQAGNYTSMTGMKVSATYIVDSAADVQAIIDAKLNAQYETQISSVVTEIASLPTTADFAHIEAIKTAYTHYAALPDSAKSGVTNSAKLIELYNAVKEITVCNTELANGEQNGALQISFTSGTDEIYGAYQEINHIGGGWANFKVNCTETPLNKTVVWYVYNPTNADLVLTYATVSGIFDAATDNQVTLTANAWTQVAIDWTYVYNISAMIFRTGVNAGDGTNITGMKVSATYIADKSVLENLA